MPTSPASAPDSRNSLTCTAPIEMPPARADPGEAPTARASYPSRMRRRMNHTTAAATSASGSSHDSRALEADAEEVPEVGDHRASSGNGSVRRFTLKPPPVSS